MTVAAAEVNSRSPTRTCGPPICIGKLVPASGAATRMFQGLLSYLAAPPSEEMPKEVRTFFDNLTRFPFYQDLVAALRADGASVDDAVRKGEHRLILRCLLEDSGLGYAQLPKGLLCFHCYPTRDVAWQMTRPVWQVSGEAGKWFFLGVGCGILINMKKSSRIIRRNGGDLAERTSDP